MAMEHEVTIDGIDVTDYTTVWVNEQDWGNTIDVITVELSSSVSTLVTLATGLSITVKRGFTTPTDEFIFDGQITQVLPQTATIICQCKSKLIEAVKAGRTYSWDKDIDTEAGVGSEIFKSICDNSGLDYDDITVPSTGTTDADKIVKFIQRDEDDFDRMNELALRYNRTIMFKPADSKVYFQPKGVTTYGTSLTVGAEIPDQIKWREDMEQLCNKVKIQGATVYDKIVETFAGPATEFTLSKTPEDTEVRINHAGANTLQTRGQKDLGTLGTDFDYYVDVEQKKLVFSGAVSDLWINYGAQVPMPVVVKNQTSIDAYGGPNKTPHYKKFTFNNLKDIADAEQRGQDLLAKYGTPFTEAEEVPVTDITIQTYGNITPGTIVNIIDSYNSKDINVFVYGIKRSWPHVYDKITVGDEIWRTENWQADQMKKINLLFNELNKNQDILVSIESFERPIVFERRYAYQEGNPLTGSPWIVGSRDYSIVGTSAVGSFSSWTTSKIIQGKNKLKEYFYDTVFVDTANTTATVNTTNREVTF